MNILLWVLQGLTTLLYGASAVMKVFLFEKVSHDVPSFRALPRGAWMAMGILELLCVPALVVPGILRMQTHWTVVAAVLLAIESLVFIGVHIKCREKGALIFSLVLGLIMAFIAYGRQVLAPFA